MPHRWHEQAGMWSWILFGAPVETREDFRKFWRERMQPDLSARIGPDRRQSTPNRSEPAR